MRAFNWSTTLLLFVALLLTASVASAGPREEGYVYYRRGAYKQALKKFSQAYRSSKKAGLLYNVAKCHEKLGQYGQAIHYYKRYLKAMPTASDRKDVEQIIASLGYRLEASYPEIEFVSSPPGANVRVDSEFAGQTPFKIQLSPGKHIVQFALKGHKLLTREFAIQAGKKRRVAVLLSSEKARGRLKVLSNVSGARVLVDGALIGLTPLEKNVTGGDHKILVEKSGYSSWSSTVRVEQDHERVVFAEIKAKGGGWSMKSILGWSLLGLAAASEGVAWVFYSQAEDQYQGSSDFERNKGLTIGMHIGAGVLAAASVTLLIWSALDSGDGPTNDPASTAGFSFGLSSLRYQW